MSFDVADAAMLLSNSYNTCLAAHTLPTQACTGGTFALLGDAIAQYQTKNGRIDPTRSATYLFKGGVGGIIWATWYAALDPVSDVWTDDILRAVDSVLYSATSVSSDEVSTAAANAIDAASSSPPPTASSYEIAQAAEEIWRSEDFMTMSSDDVAQVALSAAAAPQESSPVSPEAIHRITNTALCVSLEQFVACPIIYTLWDIPLPARVGGTPNRAIPKVVRSKLGPLLVANAKVWTPVNAITYNLPLEFRLLFISFVEIFWQSWNAKITSQPERTGTTNTVRASKSSSRSMSREDRKRKEQSVSV